MHNLRKNFYSVEEVKYIEALKKKPLKSDMYMYMDMTMYMNMYMNVYMCMYMYMYSRDRHHLPNGRRPLLCVAMRGDVTKAPF